MAKLTLFGYDSRKVDLYMKRLDREASFLEQTQKERSEMYTSRLTALQQQLGEAERKLSEMEKIEANLKQWIQRN
jgi:hypothetical protein